MGNFKKAWENGSKKDKILLVSITTLSLMVIVLAMTQLLGVWKDATYVYVPLMSVVMVLQAIQNWKRNRAVSILSWVAAGFIFVVTLIVIFLR